MKLTYTNVNGYLIPSLTYKSGEQMEQLGKYIFWVDNQDIALNIVASGYQALYLGQKDDEYYFSSDSFKEMAVPKNQLQLR